jgi:hypothetical protein
MQINTTEYTKQKMMKTKLIRSIRIHKITLNKSLLNRNVPKNTSGLTTEGPQLIHVVFNNILSIYWGHYSKKNLKRVWTDEAFLEDYDHFIGFFGL